MKTIFFYFINNEAVFEAVFKLKDNEYNFAEAIKIVIETEDAIK